jgi:pyruvate, water dikinase
MPDTMDDRNSLPNEDFLKPSGLFRRFFGRLSGYFLYFLEAIGLRKENDIDPAIQLSRLRLYHTQFRKLLSANNSFLETLADLEKKCLGREFFDIPYVSRRVIRCIADIHAMVESLNAISSDAYPVLRGRLDQVGSTLTETMEEFSGAAESRLVIDMQEVSSIDADRVGGKMANIGELRTKLGIPTPDGMAVTTHAYRLLIEKGGLRSWIQDRHMEFSSTSDAEQLAQTVQEQILQLEIPSEIENEILDSYDRLCSRLQGIYPVAVRSSAVGEDTLFSFAGQFLSILNVTKANICKAYLRVLASLYSPEAVHYRKMHGISGESAEMAVGFLAMVSAEASGVVFTKDPNEPDSGKILIQAVRGLGIPLVDGSVQPERIFVPRSGERSKLERFASHQDFRMVQTQEDGILEQPIDPGSTDGPCISDDEAFELARHALVIESHFGNPQDIEWAIDKDRRLVILQSRPLRLGKSHIHESEPLPGIRLLLKGGEIACPGVRAGPAVHMDPDGDPDMFPPGAVLVARRSSPRFVRLMSKACAIVTDVGSTTGHMASLAREFRIPAILNTELATRLIPPGMVVTVDANSGFVYEGEILDLIEKDAEENQINEDLFCIGPTQDSRFLEKVLTLIAPLNLTDPGSADFVAERCGTLHDLARFIHEKSYHEMFRLGENVGDLRGASCQLDIFLPIDLYIIDLGGGLKGIPKDRKVKRSHITSVPFSVLLKGMLHEKIPRFGPRAMDVRGLLSVIMRHATTSPEEEQSFREPCYAMISDCYMNYTARVGYHFSVVDSYCSGISNKNYVSLLFRGGAADYVRRNRRVRAIGEILREYGFSVEVMHDKVSARLSKTTREETMAQLEMIGSLFQFFRQMDAAMADEEYVSLIRDAFLSGDYGLESIN